VLPDMVAGLSTSEPPHLSQMSTAEAAAIGSLCVRGVCVCDPALLHLY
jgi:hypothetical protein